MKSDMARDLSKVTHPLAIGRLTLGFVTRISLKENLQPKHRAASLKTDGACQDLLQCLFGVFKKLGKRMLESQIEGGVYAENG